MWPNVCGLDVCKRLTGEMELGAVVCFVFYLISFEIFWNLVRLFPFSPVLLFYSERAIGGKDDFWI